MISVVKNFRLTLILLFIILTGSFVGAQESPVITNRSTTIQVVDGKEFFFHAVLQGQTLFSIARAYGVTVEDIIQQNPDLQGQELRFDQIIRIPVKHQTALPDQPKTDKVIDITYIEHQVKRRETVYGISRMYNITEAQLIEHNPQARTGLRVNTILRIPRYQEKLVYFKEYLVPPGQTLFSISREYGVSIDELQRINPELKEGLRAGQTIRIPADPGYQPPFLPSEQDEQIKEISRPAAIVYEDPYCNEPVLKPYYNVALLIPLYLENFEKEELSDRDRERAFPFMEYYEGIMIAVDSIRNMGVDIRLTVLDVCENEAKARALIWNRQLENKDLIIGPFFPEVLPVIANYAKDRNIPVVSPLPSDDRDLLRRYPNVFQAMPGILTQMLDMATFVVENYPDDNIILVHNNQPASSHLISGYKEALNDGLNRWQYYRDSINMKALDGYFFNGVYVGEKITRNVHVINDSILKILRKNQRPSAPDFRRYASRDNISEIVFSRDGFDGLTNSMDSTQRNVIITLMGGEAIITNYTRQLNQLRDTFDMVVFGVPQWRDYRSVDNNYLQNLRVHIFTNDFINYNRESNLHFIRRYRNRNHVEPQSMGFAAVQTGMYFFSALAEFGPDFSRCIHAINENRNYSTPFFFKRPYGEEGGWENHFVYIFTYRNFSTWDVRDPGTDKNALSGSPSRP